MSDTTECSACNSSAHRTCAQTLHALRLLRVHGLSDTALQTVYRAVVVAGLLYAASALWGFTTDNALTDSYGVVCVPVTVVWTSRRPPSWSKTLMSSFSTGSSTSVATFCSHCFLTVELTVMHCAIGDMTSYCSADSIH